MEVQHLVKLLSELTPNSACKYVRSDEVCVFVKIDTSKIRLYTKTPDGNEFEFAPTFIQSLAENIEENTPFNTSQILNNKGSNRAVIDSIIAHTSEFYWTQEGRSKFLVWVPSKPHNAGELVEWADLQALKTLPRIMTNTKKATPIDVMQTIFFGAPGTGKSREVKKQTGELLENGDEVDLPNVFRTTFHPDTDYASFVGCYKPSMESKEPIYTQAQLIDKLSIIKNSGASYPCQKFGAKYWESLKELSANDIKQILTACGFTDSMSVEIPKGIAIGEESAGLSSNKQIVYRFVPQVFTDAYVYAYNNSDQSTYLVIEEINRGNCAQIFGDLFQLLDRKGGVSEYKIKADKDLAQYLKEKLGVDSEGIQDGKLCLPANLHILATMNTSDQSLFPMDSAFKRRWEWEYVPINYDTSIKSGEFEITIGEKTYSWVEFIKRVNEKIFDLTQSEDKQMGNFFIKQSIDEKGFKSKVMFYLWYEVLRDETENNKYFFYKKTIVDGKEVLSKFTFKDLFGDKATETLQQFMEYLEVAPK